MRNKRRLLLLTLAIIPAIGLAVAFAQPGRNRGQQGGDTQGNPGGNRGGFDPNRIFDRYSNGQDFIEVNSWIAQSSQRDPSAKERIDAFLQQQNITNGRVTREQFAVYMQQRMAGFTGGPPGTTPGTTPGAPGQNGQIDEERIKEDFKRRDINGDGKLQPEEMSGSLRAELEKWDKNKNGTIEYDEYKEYYTARMQSRGNFGSRGQNGPQAIFDEFQQPQAEETKHVVYRRVEDLPKDLPQFFFSVPHRSVGQIALYEWKNAGMTLEEFRKYDRNSDGFITVEEVLSYQKKNVTADRRGNRGSQQEEEQPQEETLLVLAGPGAVSDDTPLNVVMMNNNRGSSQNGGFNRGGFDPNSMGRGNSRGGFPTGGMPTGGMPTGGMNRGSRGGFPTGGMPTGGMPTGGFDRSSRGGQPPSGAPGGNNSTRGSRGGRQGGQ